MTPPRPDLDALEQLVERARQEYDAQVLSQRCQMVLARECLTALPALVAEVRRLEGERDAARVECATTHEMNLLNLSSLNNCIGDRAGTRALLAVAEAEVERLRGLLDESTGIVEGQALDDEQRRNLRRIRTEGGLP
jgi:hypothetical protein